LAKQTLFFQSYLEKYMFFFFECSRRVPYYHILGNYMKMFIANNSKVLHKRLSACLAAQSQAKKGGLLSKNKVLVFGKIK
jgi:hypothetical protein